MAVAIVLDIEGTVAPISFVTEKLFPYARARIQEHLSTSYDTEETQADIELLRQQVLGCLYHCPLFPAMAVCHVYPGSLRQGYCKSITQACFSSCCCCTASCCPL
jgi:hypothetical protein